jgi:hypothetical protein
MQRSIRQRVLKGVAWLCWIANTVLFVGSLFILQTDAQGGLVFALSLPLMLGLAIGGLLSARGLTSRRPRRRVQISHGLLLLAVGLFVASGLLPALEPVGDWMVKATGRASLLVLGKTPREWAQARHRG